MSSDLHEAARMRLGATSLPRDDAEVRRRAARYVASRSADAADCAELLAALGLTATDGLTPTPATEDVQ